MNIDFWKHSITQIHESAGNTGISPNLISARCIVEKEGEDALYRFLFELTGLTKEDFKTRSIENVKKSGNSYSDTSNFSSMNRSDAKRKMKELQEFLTYHEKLYYTDPENVEITDYEYDMKMKELEELEKLHPDFIDNNSVTNRVGFEGDKSVGSETQNNFDSNLERFF